MRATLIPAAPHQPLLALQVPQHIQWPCVGDHGPAWLTHAMGAWVLDMIEGTPRAPLFSIAFRHDSCSSSTLFWMAHLQLHVNERAAEMAGVPDVRGDALVVSDYAEHSGASELCVNKVCRFSFSSSGCSSHDYTVRSPVGKVSFRIDTFKHGACLQEVRSEEQNVHAINITAGPGSLLKRPINVDQGREADCAGQCCVIRPKHQHRVLNMHKYDGSKRSLMHNCHLKRQPSPRLFARGSLRVSPRSVLNFQKKLREANAPHVGANICDPNDLDGGGGSWDAWVVEDDAQTSTRMVQSRDVPTTEIPSNLALPTGQSHHREEPEKLHVHTTVAAEMDMVSDQESGAFTDSKRLKLELPTSSDFDGSGERDIECLPRGMLQAIFGFLAFSDLSSCAAVCQQWRQCIAEDQVTLSSLSIRYRPLASHLKTPPRAHLRCSKSEQRIPFVLKCAAEAGNLSAIVLIAQELDICGEKGKALTWYKQAARKGHQLSQYKLGESYYRGTRGWQRDCCEALMWLQRAAKHPSPDPSICGAAAMMLGYMYLDGEGLDGADNSEAVKWFKIARSHGNLEAEKTVGWLWNTGQY